MWDPCGGGDGFSSDSVKSHLGGSIAQEGGYPVCYFNGYLALSHVMDESFMMDVIEGS